MYIIITSRKEFVIMFRMHSVELSYISIYGDFFFFFSLSVKCDNLKIRFPKLEVLLDVYTFISVEFFSKIYGSLGKSRLHDAFHKYFNVH